MRYSLVVTRRAAKDISRLAPDVRERLKQAIERYREEPEKYARKMVDSSLGGYRFRFGDYRIIFDLDGDNLVLLRVGHRRDIIQADEPVPPNIGLLLIPHSSPFSVGEHL